MAMPKKRMSQTRTGTRRSQISLPVITFTNCPQCNRPRLLHTACGNCGTYKGHAVIDVEKPARRAAARAAAARLAAAEEPEG